jgi:hypothetical protein
MKNIVLVILIACVSISCSEVLIETPKSIATETFYNTDAEAIAATNAAYAPIISSDFGSYYTLLESMADNVIGKGSLAAIEDYNGYSSANISNMEGVWNQLYLAIRNANFVIKNVPNGKFTSDAVKKRLVGEARYVRAFSYFALVRLWGQVPLRTDENLDLQDLGKSAVDQIYQLIIADLVDAEQNLPDAPRILGTASKWVAKTLLADVYLNRQDYKNARDKAKEVIDSGKFSLVSVKTYADFENIYGADLVTSTEEIFYCKYNDQVGWAMMNFFHIDGSGYKPYGANYFAFFLTDDHTFYKNWNNGDLRKQLLYKWDIGLGNNTYLFRKFVDPKGTTNGSNDFPIYRYPEVLLIFAEASNRLAGGPDTEALGYLNQVHRRAYGYAPTSATAIDFKLENYNEASFHELVMQEKAYETIMECKRWFDLKRTGKIEEAIKVATGKTIKPSMLLWPLPVSEIQYNKALDPIKDQNPGY